MSSKETIKEEDVVLREDTIPLPPRLAPHVPEEEIPTFSDYLLNDLFSSPLPRIKRKARASVILLIKMASHLFLLGWRKNEELEDQLTKLRDELLQNEMTKADANRFLDRLVSRLSVAMRSYVDTFGYTKMDELVKINQAEYKALSVENSAYAERILGQRFASVKFGTSGGPSLNFDGLERITLPTECRRKGKSLWKRAFRLLREKRLLKESKIIRTFSMLIESHKLLTNTENVRQGEKFVVFLGGGMAAGKSTIVNKLYGKSAGAVMIAADDFKFKDPVWDSLPRATSKMKLAVHRSSTKTAEQLLLSCLANGRSVILDGTLSWMPFVKQTIAMIQDYKNHAYYRVGPGYRVVVNPDTGVKTVTEKYWELDLKTHKRRSREYEPECRIDNEFCSKGPYRVDIVGVVCDPAEAVVRGFRRTLATSRGVPVKSQLRSHRLFATHVCSCGFLPLVDRMAVYNTTHTRDPKPCVLYDKSRNGNLYRERSKSVEDGSTVLLDTEHEFAGLMILDKKSWKMIQKTATLKDDAECASKLYCD